jgi:hypothetical protein
MDPREDRPTKARIEPHRPRLAAKALYDFAMIARELGRGSSEFIYDEELDAFRFPDGRLVFGREDADWELLRERGYMG